MDIKQKIYLGPIESLHSIIDDYDTVMIDIWSQDGHIKTQIGGNNSCKHFSIKEDNICNACGAWVGDLGTEDLSYDYFKHLFHFVSSINKNLLISSDRYYPIDFYMDWVSVEPQYFKHRYNFSVQDRVISMSTCEKRTQNCTHYAWFSNEHKSPYQNDVILYRGSLHNTMVYGKTLFVNPKPQDINYNQTIDYLICNTDIYDAVKSVISFIPRDYVELSK